MPIHSIEKIKKAEIHASQPEHCIFLELSWYFMNNGVLEYEENGQNVYSVEDPWRDPVLIEFYDNWIAAGNTPVYREDL